MPKKIHRNMPSSGGGYMMSFMPTDLMVSPATSHLIILESIPYDITMLQATLRKEPPEEP